MSDKISKSEEHWKQELTREQFYVCRQKGTEAAFTGAYWNHREHGAYHCTVQLGHKI